MANEIKPLKTTSGIPVADIKGDPDQQPITIERSNEVKEDKTKTGSSDIIVNENVLERTREKLEEIRDNKPDYTEILLALCTVSFGAVLGAFSTGLKFELTFTSVVFYVILPMVFVGTGVSFLILKNLQTKEASIMAKELLELLPDPKKATTVFKK